LFRIDILPYTVKGSGKAGRNPFADDGTLHYERTYFVHRNIGADQDMYVCPAKTLKKRCPICDYRAKLEKDPKADEDLIKSLAPKERQLFNVIDLSAPDRGVQVWDISFHLFGKLLDTKIDNADEEDGENYASFADLEGGYTLKCIAEEKNMGNKFYDVTSIDFKARKQDYGEEWLDSVHCLDDIPKILEYEDLRKIFLQTAEQDDEVEDATDDDDAPPVRNTRKPAPNTRKPNPKIEEDESEEEEVPFEEEEQEEEPPKKQPARKPPVRKPEPDPEPEEEEPEEEVEEEVKITKGTQVTFRLNGQETEGEVTSTPPNTTKVQVTTENGKRWMVERSKLSIAEAEQEEPPKRSKPQGKAQVGKPAVAGKKVRCPAGGTFGVDTDELDGCDGCPVWTECDDAKYPKK
jgi:hypothetical protein